jgi:membrane protease YdiL (CAAX protease family)
MSVKDIILNIFAISLIVILPHTELIPNFGYSIPLLLLVWLILKYSKETFFNIGFSLKQFKPKSILIGSLVAVLTLSFMQLIFFPVLENFVVFEETEVGLHAFIKGNLGQYFFIIIMGWMVGGFYEEIVFHGFIFSRLEKMIQGKYSTTIAFIGTATIFGAYHYQLGGAGLINALIVGAVYLGLFLFYKRNLWYSIFCHGAYNTIVITLIYNGYI